MIHLEFSEKSTADLRGRQSVRTTFKLSERAIDALAILAGQLGIKQKSLFDHLIEDTQALKLIAEEFNEYGRRSECVAKTYVVSRKTLDNLERISNQYATPRDTLVEYSIERILPLLAKEKQKHKKRKVLNEQLKDYLNEGLELLKRTEGELGQDDPVFNELLLMMRAVNKCCENVEEVVEKGRKIESF
ncbi:MAG: hypothetical protein GY702_11425 [Desulfobulbaceae bacterium]|nr:hypothetical protein [Desulfobulbaceae bacterium]